MFHITVISGPYDAPINSTVEQDIPIMTNLILKTSLIPLVIAGLFIATNVHAASLLIQGF